MAKCFKCGQEVLGQAKYCLVCEHQKNKYPKPAGFWIRLAAYALDSLLLLIFFTAGVFISSFLHLEAAYSRLLLSIPIFFYKPLMEHYYGATLGKMVCKIKVIDKNGKNPGLKAAYLRFLPFFIAVAVSVVFMFILHSGPEAKNVANMIEMRQLSYSIPVMPLLRRLSIIFIWIDCVVAAFTHRKRAIHDMIAGTFSVYASVLNKTGAD